MSLSNLKLMVMEIPMKTLLNKVYVVDFIVSATSEPVSLLLSFFFCLGKDSGFYPSSFDSDIFLSTIISFIVIFVWLAPLYFFFAARGNG